MTRSGLTAANPAPTSADRTATASPAATDQSKKDFFRRSRSVRPEILFSSKEATTQDAPSLKSIARPGRPAVSSQPSANQEIDTMRSINDMTASWLPLPYAKGETAMSKAKTGAWLFCALATLVLSGTPSASRAAPLPLGGIVPLSGATAAARPELAGLVLEDQLIPFTITDSVGNVIYQGTIQNRVVLSNTLGTLAFYFAIRHTDPTLGGSIISVSRTGFRDGTKLFATDEDFRSDGLESIGPP